MAKGDKKRIDTAINQQRTAQDTQNQNLRNEFKNQYDYSQGQDFGLRDTITKGYENYLNPDYVDKLIGSAGGFGGGVSGGIDPSHIANFGTDPYAGYKKLSEGLTPDFMSKFDEAMGNLDTGMNYYKDFADTGGFKPGELDRFRQQAMLPTIGAFNTAVRNLDRNKAVTGGYSPNYNASVAEAFREQGRQLSDAALGAENSITNLVQQGRQFGTKGYTDTAQVKVQARMAVQQLDNQMKEAGLAGMTDIEKTRLQAELENAQLNQNASAANSSAQSRRAEFMAGLPLEALRGLTGLYGTAPAATEAAAHDQLALEQLSQGNNLGLIDRQLAATQVPTDFSQALGNIGGTVGLIGNVAGSLAGLGGVSSGLYRTPGRKNVYTTPDFNAGFG